jgi:hypothetical protein
MMHGLTQAAVGRVAGTCGQHVGRIERGEALRADPVRLARLSAAVGLELRIRAYPAGLAIRDAAHVALLTRLRVRLAPIWRWHVEVPVAGPPEIRSWDATSTIPSVAVAYEAETRLHDIQAQARRATSKAQAGSVDRVILVVAGTHHNRGVLREVRELLRGDYRLDTRQVLTALAEGRDPGANGIVVI